jgi:parallel beta-helix repeat protein
MATYFVATNGSDGAAGSASQPFRTIQHALDARLAPGDEIVVRAGTYNEALHINTGGSAAGNVTLRAETPGSVTINPPSGGWNGISINDDYVTVQGFKINNARGDGIEANGVHHINVLDNVIQGSGESGIQFNQSEFIRVEGNTTYDNASDGWFSGISIYQNRNITGDTKTDGFRTIIRDNTSYGNVTKSGQHTDGNGIIIDDFQSTQTGGHPSYTYPTLVENNLVYLNGGKGIQVTWSDNVTVRGNTAWHNNQDNQNTGTWRGEISNSQSSDNTFVNNIAVADPSANRNNTAIDNTSYGGYTNDDVVWANNLTYSGTNGAASVRTDGGNKGLSAADGNKLGVAPGFVNAANGDFQLTKGSAAIDAGSSAFGLAQHDLDGAVRVKGTVDIGAFEAGSGSAAPQPQPQPQPQQPEGEQKPSPAPAPQPQPQPVEPKPGQGSDVQGLWDDADTSKVRADADSRAVELGMKFTADAPVEVEGLRVYIASEAADVKSVSLWSEDGDLIAKARVSDVEGKGWQEVSFDKPVVLEEGEDYVASYFTNNGRYAATSNYFTADRDLGPVSVEADAGVYSYSDRGGFPQQSFKGSNYWVDLMLKDADQAAAQQDQFVFAANDDQDAARANQADDLAHLAQGADADLAKQAQADHQDWGTSTADQDGFDWAEFQQNWQATLDHAA